MFKNPFSFDGRIRRTEYGLSLIIYFIAAVIVQAIIASGGSNGATGIFGLAYFPMLWFLWAEGAKRCHDVGNNGWWQLIPFYALWLVFEDGDIGPNQYGENPKGISNLGSSNNSASQSSSNNKAGYQGGGYQGGYTGGHNDPTPNANLGSSEKLRSDEGYKDGDLYK